MQNSNFKVPQRQLGSLASFILSYQGFFHQLFFQAFFKRNLKGIVVVRDSSSFSILHSTKVFPFFFEGTSKKLNIAFFIFSTEKNLPWEDANTKIVGLLSMVLTSYLGFVLALNEEEKGEDGSATGWQSSSSALKAALKNDFPSFRVQLSQSRVELRLRKATHSCSFALIFRCTLSNVTNF